MNAAKTAQQIANDKAYSDGVRCRNKGLGLKKSGIYDYDAWRRLFELGFRKLYRSIDKEKAYEEWCEGWHDEDDRLSCLAQGQYPCGRPI